MEKINVAFADNHVYLLETTSYYLSDSEIINIALRARDGIDLIEKIESASYKPDVCLVDIRMPRMNGFKTIKYIKRKWPDIKTIAFSGYGKKAYLEELILLGVNSFLRKDIHPKELIKAIIDVHKEGIYYSGDFNMQACRNICNRPPPFFQLSEMERRIVNLIINGKSYAEIAGFLNLSAGSVESQRRNIFYTIGVNNKVDLVSYILRNGYIDIIKSD